MWLNIINNKWNVNINLELIYSIGIYTTKHTYSVYSVYINGYEIETFVNEEDAMKFIDKFMNIKYKMSQSDYIHRILTLNELKELMNKGDING